jgi:hypothetical protein
MGVKPSPYLSVIITLVAGQVVWVEQSKSDRCTLTVVLVLSKRRDSGVVEVSIGDHVVIMLSPDT